MAKAAQSKTLQLPLASRMSAFFEASTAEDVRDVISQPTAKRSTGLNANLTQFDFWSIIIRSSTSIGEGSSGGGKNRDYHDSDVETHIESEVGVFDKTGVKRVL